MRPLGMDGSRKLSDLLIDAKVAQAATAGVPVVRDGERIVWLAGSADERGVPGRAGDGRAVRLTWYRPKGSSARCARAGRTTRGAWSFIPTSRELILSEDEMQARVRELGAEISADYGDEPVLLVAVLRGAAIFVADLARTISLPVELDFMAVSSYGSSTKSSGVVRILKDLDETIEGRNVLVCEDILDTGLTLKYLLKNLASRKPALTRGRRAAEQGGQAAGTYQIASTSDSTCLTSSSSDMASTMLNTIATCHMWAS